VSLRSRVAYFLLGLIVSSLAYGLTVRAGLGLGPLFMIQEGLELRLGLSPGAAAALVGVAFVLVGVLAGGLVGIGTVMGPVISGVMIDLVLPVLPSVGGFAARAGVCTAASFTMMLGAALVHRSALGSHGLDATMVGLSGRTGWPSGQVRLGMEVLMLLAGLGLGAAAGWGTVITAAVVGPAFDVWCRVLDRFSPGPVGLLNALPGR
jgi:uncharacterized membrane protein YczE